MVSYGGWL